jgi:hypothetical protein
MSWSYWTIGRIQAKQKRKALHLLMLSGVVRPSDVEPRYYVPLLKLKTGKVVNPPAVWEVGRPPAAKRTISPITISKTLGTWLRPSFSWAPLFRRLDSAGPAENRV